MEIFKIGKVVSIGKTYLIFESNYSGHIIYVAHPETFIKDKVIKLYTYNHVSEYTSAIYGFANFKERIMFEDLISVNGIGPKTALAALKLGCDNIMSYIATEDSKSLSSIPQIGLRTANQLIFELRDKYQNFKNKTNGISVLQIGESLKTLGFNKKQIEYAIKVVKPAATLEEMVEEAIKVISNEKFATA